MKPGDEGVETEVMEGLKFGVMPTVFDIVVDGDHVIGVVLAEGNGGGVVVIGEGEELLTVVLGHLAGLANRQATWKVEAEVARLIFAVYSLENRQLFLNSSFSMILLSIMAQKINHYKYYNKPPPFLSYWPPSGGTGPLG